MHLPSSPSPLSHSSPSTLTATSIRRSPLGYPLPPGFSRESLLHNSSIQNPSCPDTALPSTTLTFFFIIQQCPFSTGISVVSAPIEITSVIYFLSMNLMLYAFKKPSGFNHPHQSLTTTSSILLILLLLLLFLSIIRHHILTSTLPLLFLVLCYESSFNVGLPLFMTHSPLTLCMTCNTLSFCTPHSAFLSLLHCCTNYSFSSLNSSISISPP